MNALSALRYKQCLLVTDSAGSQLPPEAVLQDMMNLEVRATEEEERLGSDDMSDMSFIGGDPGPGGLAPSLGPGQNQISPAPSNSSRRSFRRQTETTKQQQAEARAAQLTNCDLLLHARVADYLSGISPDDVGIFYLL